MICRLYTCKYNEEVHVDQNWDKRLRSGEHYGYSPQCVFSMSQPVAMTVFRPVCWPDCGGVLEQKWNNYITCYYTMAPPKNYATKKFIVPLAKHTELFEVPIFVRGGNQSSVWSSDITPRGVWGHAPPRIFWNLGPLRFLLRPQKTDSWTSFECCIVRGRAIKQLLCDMRYVLIKGLGLLHLHNHSTQSCELLGLIIIHV